MEKIIDGKKISLEIKEEIIKFINERKNKNLRVPKIASILVGNDGGSIYYINNQEKIATSLGIKFDKLILEEDIKEDIKSLIYQTIIFNRKNYLCIITI